MMTTSTPRWSPTQISQFMQSYTALTIDEYFAQQPATSVDLGNMTTEPQVTHYEEPEQIEDAPSLVTNDDIFELFSLNNTKLTNHNSLLVDIGSQINVIGRHTHDEFVGAIGKAKKHVAIKPRHKRMLVNGVGAGSAICDNEATYPVAVKFQNKPATEQSYKANIAEGVGSNLPAILGSKSMQDKDAVIVMRKGEEFLAFPGKGGYRIQWSPGTELLPLTSAPSGHLVISCDNFDDLTQQPMKRELVFLTDNSNE
jgi:hypothetical protein